MAQWSQTQFLEGLSSAQFNHTCREVSSNPEDLDYLDQVCLIRVGAKLCRAVALQELGLRPMIWHVIVQGSATFNAKRVILAPFLPNKIHVEPQNI